jgi:hypothetical protein
MFTTMSQSSTESLAAWDAAMKRARLAAREHGASSPQYEQTMAEGQAILDAWTARIDAS